MPSFARRLFAQIAEHYARHRRRSALRFVFVVTAEALAAAFATLLLCERILGPDEGQSYALEALSPWQRIATVLVIAPLTETFFLQVIPTYFFARASARWQVAVCTLVFFLAHVPNGLNNGFAGGLVGGFYYAFSYVHWRKQRSWTTAYFLVALMHLLYNGTVLMVASV